MRNKKQFILLILAAAAATGIQAQKLPEFRKLPSDNNANTIIRKSVTEFEYLSKTAANEKNSQIISVQKGDGRDDAEFICFCDKFRELKQFSGELYSANGTLIRKFKKGDLRRTEYYEGLASDDYMYYLEIPSTVSLPFTVKYDWEVKHKNGLVSFPVFYPQTNYDQAVDTAWYQLTMPAEEEFRYKVINDSIAPRITDSKKGRTYTFCTGSLAPIEREPFGLSLTAAVPHILFAPNEFIFDGTTGNLKDWQSFGLWEHGLQNGRDALPEKAKQKIREVTANCPTDRDKVKALYDYLGNSTRYVSIQLGIGGLQPTPATDVFNSGFGDCKGLSNYMMAMLKEIGIPSNYTIISTDRSRLFRDFASANQMNHVILQVPLSGDTLWLECTNTSIPFGYVHGSIAGHDALVITSAGGEIQRLPNYADTLHTEIYSTHIDLTENGVAFITASRESNCLQHEMSSYFEKLTEAKQKEDLMKSIRMPNLRINSIQVENQKDARPSFRVAYAAEGLYATQNGNRLVVPTNVFRPGFRTLNSKKTRKQPIVLGTGYVDSDTIRIRIPENYTVETMPGSILLNSKFGNYYSIVSLQEQEIRIIQRLHIKRGHYPIANFTDFCDFTEKINNHYSGKIILKKKEI